MKRIILYTGKGGVGKTTAAAATALQAVLDDARDTIGAPGLAAAVIAAGRGTWAGAAGTADGAAELDPAAQFGIGSITKTVTAAEVLQLVESGVVGLDEPIATYIRADELPTNGAIRSAVAATAIWTMSHGRANALAATLSGAERIGVKYAKP